MNEETFKRASEIQVALRRVDKVIELTAHRGKVVIHGEHFSVEHPLGAAVLETINNYRSQLVDEFNSL